jgi:two-component system response regulator FixJ
MQSERWNGAHILDVNMMLRSKLVPVSEAENLKVADAIRVAVIDDDARMLQALTFQLGTAGFTVRAYESAENFIRESASVEFDCVVADLLMPGMNGLQLQDHLARAVPCASIVFLTGHGDLSAAMHAMRNGAADFLEKPVDDGALVSSITRGAEQTRTRRAEQAERLDLERRQSTLTPREREVFNLITAGLLNKQAGAELGTTERTIKTHRGRVMDKMCAESLADLVRMAAILGIHPARTQPARRT